MHHSDILFKQYPSDILGIHLYDSVSEELKNSEYNCLEIGVFNGAGTALLGNNFPNKTIYAVDPFIEDGNTDWITRVGFGNNLNIQKENFYNNVKHLSNIVPFEESSDSFSKKLKPSLIKQMNVGWVIIDGDHSYEAVSIDYNLALKLIDSKPNSGIVFDDVNLPGVDQAFNEFKQKYNSIIKNIEHYSNVNMIIIKF
jgi:hypothetical protein